MSFEMIKATPVHAPDLRLNLEEARDFKCSLGDMVWSDKPFTLADAEEIIAKGSTYVALLDGQVAGSVALTWQDPRMWGEQGLDEQAGYIHRLATRGAFRGQGVGRRVVSWVCEQVQEASRPYVRLDCSYDNPGLCAYYEAQGFTEVGRKELFDPYYAVAFYQKEV
jgi:ribosomal protein S18 acetylase RimI-like enzyme